MTYNKTLAVVAASALPIQEIAFALPHRLEFPFCVAVACALVCLFLSCRSSIVGQISEPNAVPISFPVMAFDVDLRGADLSGIAKNPQLNPLERGKQIAASFRKAFTVEDLKGELYKEGIELKPLELAEVLRDFEKVGEVKSSNPKSKGRKIGVYSPVGAK